jgi:chemotaxis protein histidine kinase CheA
MAMTPADQAKYKALYIQTSRQYLEKIENAIAQLLENPTNEEAQQELFIAAHSLSGQSGVMGYQHIGEYTTIIQNVIEEKIALDTQLLQIIQTGAQKITASLEEIEKNDMELDLSEEISILQEKTTITRE